MPSLIHEQITDHAVSRLAMKKIGFKAALREIIKEEAGGCICDDANCDECEGTCTCEPLECSIDDPCCDYNTALNYLEGCSLIPDAYKIDKENKTVTVVEVEISSLLTDGNNRNLIKHSNAFWAMDVVYWGYNLISIDRTMRVTSWYVVAPNYSTPTPLTPENCVEWLKPLFDR